MNKLGGRKINRIAKAFSKVKQDVTLLYNRLAESQKVLNELKQKVENATTKEEFYDFIRELNEELRKLEKHIATQDSLDRLRATLKTQIGELEREIQARKVINKRLSTVDKLEERTKALQKRMDGLNELKKKLAKIESSYVDWAQFLKRVKEINQEENEASAARIHELVNQGMESTKEEFSGLKRTVATKRELREQRNELKKRFKEQSSLIKLQAKRIERLEKVVAKVTGKPPPKKIPSKPGIIERGLNYVQSIFGKTHIFPILVLIAIAALLVVGIIFFREDIFSPGLYLDAKSIECRSNFECQELSEGQYLTDCRYDESLQGCHCIAKPAELANCPSK